ncbi:hypothetical protein BMT54_09580 [Pasteurellaceae bacterium 15-036681]|nr:hypothetical protein BMT54_09580 [Pasteurellaceae bacterium 15-036681]
MRLGIIFSTILLLSGMAQANWKAVSSTDYEWGPFRIYHVALSSETGSYNSNTRPLMLTFDYEKPVDGRDFAISLARTWGSLGISLPNQDNTIDSLRKILPNIKKGDRLVYIALENKGYFILNNVVIPTEFDKDFNDAVLAVWLDPRVDIGRNLLANINPELVKETSEQTIELGPAEPEDEKMSDELKGTLQGTLISATQEIKQTSYKNSKPLGDKEPKKAPQLAPRVGIEEPEPNEPELEIRTPADPIPIKLYPLS